MNIMIFIFFSELETPTRGRFGFLLRPEVEEDLLVWGLIKLLLEAGGRSLLGVGGSGGSGGGGVVEGLWSCECRELLRPDKFCNACLSEFSRLKAVAIV